MPAITRSAEPSAPSQGVRRVRGRRGARRTAVVALVVAVLAAYGGLRIAHHRGYHDYLASGDWPVRGQAALAVGTSQIESSPDQRPVPIASVAKVMTAYLVLSADPLRGDANGFTMMVTPADVADTAVRRQNGESLVAVRAGEVLTERQALAALLLPSANNVAVMIARHVAGSVGAFVATMNRTARALGMTHTTYTDPSGLDAGTRSTAADQVILARHAMRLPAFAEMVGTSQYELPVAGTVHSTDSLLGSHGFVGIKTGSDTAAGGCFVFRTRRVIDGHLTYVTGVVLGQRGSDLIAAGLAAASQLADRVAPA